MTLTSQMGHAQDGGRRGTAGSALLGGTIGALSGGFLGAVIGRGTCADTTDVCRPPLIVGGLLGASLGTYAGATDTRRVEGAAIGLGAGALGGMVLTAIFIRTGAIAPRAEEWSPIAELVQGALIGAAAGSLLGGMIRNTPKGDPLASATMLTIVHFSF